MIQPVSGHVRRYHTQNDRESAHTHSQYIKHTSQALCAWPGVRALRQFLIFRQIVSLFGERLSNSPLRTRSFNYTIDDVDVKKSNKS